MAERARVRLKLNFKVSEVGKRSPSFNTEVTEAPEVSQRKKKIWLTQSTLLKTLCASSVSSVTSVLKLGDLS
jgi:hypothetical protein